MTTRTLTQDQQKLSVDVIWAFFGVCLLAITSQISIPLQPVPVTLQTAGVMLIGLQFSRRAALSSVAVYLCIGACGLPIFAEFSSGTRILIGPSAGYLIGFFFAVWAMSYVKTKSLLSIFLNCLLGTGIIFVFGISWLSTLIGFQAAIASGFLPFILPGCVKAALLSLGVRYLRKA